MCMEMETLLVFLSGIQTKKVLPCATLSKNPKVILSSQGLTTFNVQQVDVFICFPSYPKRGIMGCIRIENQKDVSTH